MGTTVVCGVDTEDEAVERTLEVAADLARRLGLALVAGHVRPTDAMAVGPPLAGPIVPAPAPALAQQVPTGGEEERSELREEARRRVERLVEQSGAGAAEVEIALDASPADGLRRIAAERDAALLVVGSHGHGAVRAALLGSTSHGLAAHAPCPVVVVPPRD